ncbi:MAG: endolytic transglycosylase MltG [Syntrophobacteraceae bacterium]
MRKLTAGAGALLFAAALVTGYILFHAWLFLRLPGGSERAWIVVEIPPRTAAMSVAQLLEEKHLISDAQKFYLLCRYRKASSRLRAGEYGFAGPTTPDQILERLIQGKVLLHRLTIPEGSSLWDVARIVEEQGLGAAQDIERLARDPELIQSLGIAGPNLEGYLFPETYQLPKTQDPQAILRAMVQQFRQQFPESLGQAVGRAWNASAGCGDPGIHRRKGSRGRQ